MGTYIRLCVSLCVGARWLASAIVLSVYILFFQKDDRKSLEEFTNATRLDGYEAWGVLPSPPLTAEITGTS